MDPNTVVLEISSDEDVGWNDNNGRGIADGGDDHDWLAELLDEVHKGNFGDDTDELVVVSEVSPSEKTGKKSKLKSSLLDLDDDCVILDKDPEKPVEVLNDKPSNVEGDSDDIVVVSEKGQVACRDYPHPRHLCIKFPFSTTPNQNHCDQCYCYVCDSLAPCVYWGNGSSPMDHCHATDKDELWKHQRKNAKNGTKVVPLPLPPVADVARFNGLHLHPHRQPPPPQPGGLIHPHHHHHHHPSGNFRPPNIITQNRRPVFPTRGKLHPDLFHQYMVARSKGRAHPGIPTLKRTGAVATAPNRHHPYGPHRGNSVNRHGHTHTYSGSLQPNLVNTTPVSYPQNQHHTVNVNQQWPLQPQFTNQSNHFYPTNPVPANPPSYHVPVPVPVPTTRVDNNAPSISVSDYTNLPEEKGVDDNGLSWPTHEGSGPGIGPVSDTSSVGLGLGDHRYDWIFDNQPVEPGFGDGGPGSYGLTDFSSDSFIDTGPIFDF
ncbi:hypothetical protein LXL04_000885 [Taraxacum kok-saghyz]